MAQITLDIPNTLHHRLEGLAQYEGVQPPLYILYVLMQWAGEYTVHHNSEDDVAQQKAEYMALCQRWQTASSAQVSEVLAKRKEVEPEPELKPETVRMLRQRIDEQRSVIETVSE